MRSLSALVSSRASVVALAIAVPTSALVPVSGTSSATRWRSVSVGRPGSIASGFSGGGGGGPCVLGPTWQAARSPPTARVPRERKRDASGKGGSDRERHGG